MINQLAETMAFAIQSQGRADGDAWEQSNRDRIDAMRGAMGCTIPTDANEALAVLYTLPEALALLDRPEADGNEGALSHNPHFRHCYRSIHAVIEYLEGVADAPYIDTLREFWTGEESPEH